MPAHVLTLRTGLPATRAVPRSNPRISGHITGVTRVSVEGRPGERSFALLSTTLSHDVALTCENVTKHVVSAVGEALNRCCAPVNAHEALQHEKTPRKRGVALANACSRGYGRIRRQHFDGVGRVKTRLTGRRWRSSRGRTATEPRTPPGERCSPTRERKTEEPRGPSPVDR